ncbi:MAG: nucleotidyltransferase [Desulfuromonadales bacterium]|nr:nucleotidyltransferase [Desulfuromonadales bacterium]
MLNTDYKEMLSILNEEEVDYLVVGAYALAAYGLPRATGDIDIFIRPSLANAEKVFRSLARFGAPLADLGPGQFAEEGIVFQIGVAPCRIDILNRIDGVAYDEAENGRNLLSIEGVEIPFIGLKELKKNKLATGRTRDRLDVEMLEELAAE